LRPWTSYHFYQGILGAVVNLAIGAVFTGCYVRHGKLWPLIVAHAMLDFATLGIYIVQVLPI
jgi:membrane protease YdiL (CAAX protease family)